MTTVKQIQFVMEKMTVILRSGALYDWAITLDKLRDEIALEPNATARTILAMYGGMGSLNDIILYRNGQPLISENNDFDLLRSQLFEFCRDLVY